MIQLTKGTNVLDINLSDFSGAGQDVVQNGSFNDIGLDLVQNGDFSEIGSELVTNGDFSAVPLGSELLPEGASPMTGSWGSNGTIIDGKLKKTASGIAYRSIGETNGKLYKVIVDVASLDGATNFWLAGTNSANLVVGINTISIFAGSTSGYGAAINNGFSTGVGSVINSISVKEQINLVTNSNFSATGSELVDNNDFSNGTTDWSADGGSTISVGTHEGRSDVADINITGTATNNRISHAFSWTEGSSYKVTCEVYVVSGSFRIDTADSLYAGDFVSTDVLGSWQTLTGYITSNTTGSQDFWLRSMLDGAVGEVSQFYVDSVSIKELGEDWVAYTSGTSTVEFPSTGAELNIDALNSNVGIYQTGIFTLGKSYKIVLSMKATSSFDAEVVESSGAATESTIGTVSLTTEFQTFSLYHLGTGTFDLFIHRLYTETLGASQTITIQSVVVQELGEGWTLGTGINISENLANFTGSPNANINQNAGLITGKSYKIVFTISNYVSGDIDYNVGGNTRQGNIAANGTYTDYVVSDSGNLLYFQSDQTLGFVGSITNISVKEVGQDWTLGTGWSIGDSEAISDGTGNFQSISQSCLVNPLNKSY